MSTKYSNEQESDKSLGFAEIREEVDRLLAVANENDESMSNPFPVEVFPEKIQTIIRATNKSLSFPVDFIGSSIILAVSAAIGNTYRVKVTNAWLENAAIYIALVGKPGTNKSHPLSFALQPILDKDKRSFRQYERDKLQYDKIIAQIKRVGKDDLLEEPSKPTWQKNIVSDFTPEALAHVHKCNKRGICAYVDELAGWFKNFNRYHKGNEQEFWLSSWSGKPINIDRKTGDPVYLSNPFISVAGTIQSGILYQLGKEGRMHNGFMDRILFVIPDNLQKSYWNNVEIDKQVIQSWEDIISILLELPFNLDENLCPHPGELYYHPDAWSALIKWQKHNTDLINKSDSDFISGMYSKFEIYAIRLSLILQMLKWASDNGNKETIEADSLHGAIALVEYFRKNAEKVDAIISNYSPLDNLNSEKKNVYMGLPFEFSTDEGLEVARLHDMSTRTFQRFITDRKLFRRIKKGLYQKQI
jgi:hypothetical protein